jgi:predicted transcriptional regulator
MIMATVKVTDEEITQYLPHLNYKQKEAVLSVVKTFASEQKDWWDEISVEQQAAIDKSLAEMKAGNLTPHDQVMKQYKKWLKK